MATSSALPGHTAGTSDPLSQIKMYKQCVSVLADPASKEELKVKAAMELTDNYETIITSPHYQSFLDHSIKLFLKVLQEGIPLFVSEYNMQQVRRLYKF